MRRAKSSGLRKSTEMPVVIEAGGKGGGGKSSGLHTRGSTASSPAGAPRSEGGRALAGAPSLHGHPQAGPLPGGWRRAECERLSGADREGFPGGVSPGLVQPRPSWLRGCSRSCGPAPASSALPALPKCPGKCCAETPGPVGVTERRGVGGKAVSVLSQI